MNKINIYILKHPIQQSQLLLFMLLNEVVEDDDDISVFNKEIGPKSLKSTVSEMFGGLCHCLNIFLIVVYSYLMCYNLFIEKLLVIQC